MNNYEKTILIAEKIMEWDGSASYPYPLFRPYSRLSDAWKVVEKMNSEQWHLAAEQDELNNMEWNVGFIYYGHKPDDYESYFAKSEKFCVALCDAALYAMGYEDV